MWVILSSKGKVFLVLVKPVTAFALGGQVKNVIV